MIEANCHCGGVRMQIASPPEAVTDCNCSICRRYGTLWAYYAPKDVRFVSSGDSTAIYMWGDRDLEFHHCRVCGCVTHWRVANGESDRMGVNARLMEPEDLAGARVRKLDGADTWKYRDENGLVPDEAEDAIGQT